MPRVQFRAALWRHPSDGGWHFVTVPEACAPSHRLAWGRTPVTATVDGVTWRTSVWRGKDGVTALPVPRTVRGGRPPGTEVDVTLEFA